MIAISAFIFLFSATEFHQLVRLPMLISHYQSHKQTDPEMNILAFLSLHYTADHPDDKDDDDDSNLPFKQAAAIAHIDQTTTIQHTEPRLHTWYVTVNTQTWHPEGIPCHRAYPVFHPPQA